MTPETPNTRSDSEPVALDYALTDEDPPGNLGASFALASGIAAVTIGFVMPIIIGLIAVVVGLAAIVRIDRNPRHHAGRRMAIAGLALGTCGLSVQTFDAYREIRHAIRLSMRTDCAQNLRTLGEAIQAHANDDPDGAFPDDLRKLEYIGARISQDYRCPSASEDSQDYYYVPGYSLSSDVESVIMYEGADHHEGGGGNVLYAEGVVRFLSKAELQKVIDDNKDRAK